MPSATGKESQLAPPVLELRSSKTFSLLKLSSVALRNIVPNGAPAPAARYAPASRDYYVTFTRKTVRISSYQDDAIKAAVETWADDVPELD